jgi:cell division protein FtsQ
MGGRGQSAQPGKRRPARRAPAVVPLDQRLGRWEFVSRIRRLARNWTAPLRGIAVPRGAGLGASALLILVAVCYGVVRGDHVPTIVGQLKDARDAAANAAGFAIQSVSVAGRKQLREKEILAAAGVGERSSLLFLDVEAARARLKANPWIAEAEVHKLYPGRLQITIEEREAFALWQKDGRIAVIATDGAVLAPFAGERRFSALPLVVGPGAEIKAKDFVAVLARYPAIREQMRAAIFIAERRWNLRLKNGIDVRLPEADVERALDTLAALDRDKKLLSRDITAVDLRLPDRVSVRQSDGVAQAREDALKKRFPKKKGGDA